MPSIKISQLANLGSVTTDDFLALVDSGSLTTYRVSIATWNALWDTYGSASHADTATTATNTTSASYALSSSYAITASYSLTSSNVPAGGVVGTVTSASYALTSSYGISGSFATNAISASWALSSSYAFSSSYSFSGSYAITASHASTSSYALIAEALSSPTAVTVPPVIKSLYIYPETGSITGENGNEIQVIADEAVLYNNAGNAVRISYPNQVIDRSVSGAGGTHAVWGNNEWYDIYLIYNSGTSTLSAMITSSGAIPRQTTGSSPSGMPSGYDYWLMVGSVKHEGDTTTTMWREWYVYGSQTEWVYRTVVPSNHYLANGYTLTHRLGVPPRDVQLKMRINQTDASVLSWGYAEGDFLDANDSISDYDDGEVEAQPFGRIVTSTQVKVWRTRASNGWESSNPTGRNTWNSRFNYLDLYIYAKK